MFLSFKILHKFVIIPSFLKSFLSCTELLEEELFIHSYQEFYVKCILMSRLVYILGYVFISLAHILDLAFLLTALIHNIPSYLHVTENIHFIEDKLMRSQYNLLNNLNLNLGRNEILNPEFLLLALSLPFFYLFPFSFCLSSIPAPTSTSYSRSFFQNICLIWNHFS